MAWAGRTLVRKQGLDTSPQAMSSWLLTLSTRAGRRRMQGTHSKEYRSVPVFGLQPIPQLLATEEWYKKLGPSTKSSLHTEKTGYQKMLTFSSKVIREKWLT